MYRWEDGTVNHDNRYEVSTTPPSVAILWNAPHLHIVPLSSIGNSGTQHILCEKDVSETRTPRNRLSGKPRVQLPSSDSDSVGFPYIVCSSGHYTHLFLACEVRSDCLQHDPSRQSSGSDDTLMTPCTSNLATLFTCGNGLGHVPYSLVCDHSQDCLDSSDEDFCVYPSCSGSWQFECANRQVRQKKKGVTEYAVPIRIYLHYFTRQTKSRFVLTQRCREC